MVEDIKTPVTSMDRLSKKTNNKQTMALNDTLDQMDLTDIFRTFHPKVAGYTFFSSAWNVLQNGPYTGTKISPK